MLQPPAILDGAVVLEFAVLDSDVSYTGKITTYMNGNLVGPVPNLAICQNPGEDDYLIFYCNEKWEVLAAGGGESMERVKSTAEKGYKGISPKWILYSK